MEATNKIEFEQVVKRGCGLDVHKETVVATVAGDGIKEETRTYETFTSSLKDLGSFIAISDNIFRFKFIPALESRFIN